MLSSPSTGGIGFPDYTAAANSPNILSQVFSSGGYTATEYGYLVGEIVTGPNGSGQTSIDVNNVRVYQVEQATHAFCGLIIPMSPGDVAKGNNLTWSGTIRWAPATK